jgi:2-keto-3-deoxy-L-rhamnonate aldolase RhmA
VGHLAVQGPVVDQEHVDNQQKQQQNSLQLKKQSFTLMLVRQAQERVQATHQMLQF